MLCSVLENIPLPRTWSLFPQCVSKVGFSRQIRGEVGEAANQIAFDNFSKVYKKVQERITKVCCAFIR